MKSFIQFLSEMRHETGRYNQWGMIDTNNQFVNGKTDKIAEIHLDLRKHNPDSNRVVDYFQEKRSKANPQQLVIRTYGKQSLDRAIKNFDKFPHIDTGYVLHIHGDGKTDYVEHSGNRDDVLKNMVKYRSSLSKR